MKRCRPLAVMLLLSSSIVAFADTVELNGIASLFGKNMAFLLLHRQGPAGPESFILQEGESQFGIRLLAVDVQNQRVEIQQLGETQYLRLEAAPDLAVLGAPEKTSGQSAARQRLTPQARQQLDDFLNRDQDVQKIRAGSPAAVPLFAGNKVAGSVSGNPAGTVGSTPVVNNNGNSSGAPGGTPDQSSLPSGNSTDSSGGSSAYSSNPASNASSASSSIPDATQQPWYIESQNIELTRLETAGQVASGDAQPLPRTPLTPANTPASLVSSVTYFGNHIPGFICGGSPYGVDENGDPVP